MPPRPTDVIPLKYTGTRKDEFNALKQAFGRIAEIPTDLIKRLNTNERRSKNAKAKRAVKAQEEARRREAEIERQIALEMAERRRKDEERRIKRNQKAREKRAREREEKKLRLQAIPFEQLAAWVQRKVGNKDLPFRLSLRSANSRATSTFNFKSHQHFVNWFDAIERQSVQQDSTNYTTFAEITGDRDVFAMIIPDLVEIDGGCNYHGKEYISKDTPFYTLNLYNPITGGHNNCAFKILERLAKVKLNYSELRKQYGVEKDARITTDVFNKIYRSLGLKSVVVFIDETFNEEMNKAYEYIFIADNHYYYVESAEYKSYKDKHTKRGMLYWDIETRPTEEYVMVGNTKSYILKDAILCAYYKPYKGEYQRLTFRSGSVSSCRQFLDWLTKEANDGHYYYCIAHN